LPSTARIGRAHSDRARSASKEGTWPLPPLLHLLLHPPYNAFSLEPVQHCPFYYGERWSGIYFVLGPEKSSTYSSEYASGFSEPAAAYLPAPPSPRHEWQRRKGSCL